MNGRVLVVDDQPDNRLLVRMVLGRAGFEVAEADSGMECVRIAKDFHPDVMILDVRLPDIDGVDLLSKLRLQEELVDVPVIILSADSSHAARERAEASDAYAYVSKPFEPSDLLAMVTRALKI